MSRVVDVKGNINITQRTDIGGNTITQDVSATVGNYTITYPGTQGNDKAVLVNDGTGALSWKPSTKGDLRSLLFNPFATSVDTTTLITGLPPFLGRYSPPSLAPNGKLYYPPNLSNDNSNKSVLIIDTHTNTADGTTIPLPTADRWWTSTLATNGKIYSSPWDTNQSILIIDPETNTIDTSSLTIGVAVTGGTWTDSQLAPNGKIYCCPANNDQVLIIDPINNTVDTSTISGLSGTNKWEGMCLAPNGKLYCAPWDSTSVLIIDPSDDTVDVVSITGITGRYWYMTLAPNGKMYSVGYNTGTILIIDPITNTADTSTITFSQVTGGNVGMVLAPDGKIYSIPSSSTYVLIIDPETDTIDTTTISGLSSDSSKWTTGILSLEGKIYCAPFKSTYDNFLIIPTGDATIPIERCTSSYFK